MLTYLGGWFPPWGDHSHVLGVPVGAAGETPRTVGGGGATLAEADRPGHGGHMTSSVSGAQSWPPMLMLVWTLVRRGSVLCQDMMKSPLCV